MPWPVVKTKRSHHPGHLVLSLFSVWVLELLWVSSFTFLYKGCSCLLSSLLVMLWLLDAHNFTAHWWTHDGNTGHSMYSPIAFVLGSHTFPQSTQLIYQMNLLALVHGNTGKGKNEKHGWRLAVLVTNSLCICENLVHSASLWALLLFPIWNGAKFGLKMLS